MQSSCRSIILGLLLLLVGCVNHAPSALNRNSPQLTVFAAASLTEAFTDVATEFEASYPGVEVLLNFAGSQTLRVQIEQGGRADVFASANQAHADGLLAANLIEQPVIFAHNQMIVIVPATNPASVETLADLTQPGLKLVLAGPSVPAGRYARELLEKLNTNPALGADFATRVLQNLVSAEDTVKGVVAKVQLGEADAGIVYLSDITSAVADDVITLTIPTEYNITADYPIAITTNTHRPDLARQFMEFVLSPAGQTILTDHGFQPVQPLPLGQTP